MSATLTRPARDARRIAPLLDAPWETLTEDERDERSAIRAAELDADQRRAHDRLRLIAAALDVAAQMAAAFARRHLPGCDCAGCFFELRNARPLLLAGDAAGWSRMHEAAKDWRDRMSGVVTTAGYSAEWAGSALAGLLPAPLDMDGRTFGDDLRRLADLADAVDAADEAAEGGGAEGGAA